MDRSIRWQIYFSNLFIQKIDSNSVKKLKVTKEKKANKSLVHLSISFILGF